MNTTHGIDERMVSLKDGLTRRLLHDYFDLLDTMI